MNTFAIQGDLFLALAHLIDDDGKNEYARFHRRMSEEGRRVILDNGLFEGAQVSTESLLQRARVIKASVVCAPDSLYDSAGTIKRFKEFIRAKQEVGLVSEVMGIPQANNPDDWWECWRFMELSKECDIIGLSILSIPQSFKVTSPFPITGSRLYLLKQLYFYQDILGRQFKPCHLLGLGESYADIICANQYLPKQVLSNDSSSAFVHGMHGVRYDKNGHWTGGKISEKLDFSLEKVDNESIIQQNINIAKNISNVTRWTTNPR